MAIQIYGRDIPTMVEAAKIVEQACPDILDLNFGCPVKKVAGKGAGSGMLRDIPKLLAIDSANKFAHFACGEYVCVQRVGILFDGFVDGLQCAEWDDTFANQLVFVDTVGTPCAVFLRLFPRNADNGIVAESNVCVVVACEWFVVGQLFAPYGFVGHGEQNFAGLVCPHAANPSNIFAPVEVGYFVFVQEVTAVADAALCVVVWP